MKNEKNEKNEASASTSHASEDIEIIPSRYDNEKFYSATEATHKKKTGSTGFDDTISLTHTLSRSRIPTSMEDEDAEEAEVHDTRVKRALKQRHIGMIALGGTIGTGLFVGISTPLSNSGPVGALIAYIFMGTIIYFVTQSLGEMATFIPVTSSITVFSKRFLSPAFGVANGYMYWFNWAITYAVEVSVIGQVIQYWTFKVPLAAWITAELVQDGDGCSSLPSDERGRLAVEEGEHKVGTALTTVFYAVRSASDQVSNNPSSTHRSRDKPTTHRAECGLF